MAIRDKNTLKTFFETGNTPLQNQFADLIDSLKHQNDTLVLTDEQIVFIANYFATIENPSVQYIVQNMGDDSLIKLGIAQENEENQTIEITSSIYEATSSKKQYFFLSDKPYTISIEEIKSKELNSNEYYFVSLGDRNNGIQKLIGHKLPTTLKDFEFDSIDVSGFNLSISKQNFEKELSVIHTNIEFVNKTDIPIEYKCHSYYWSNSFTAKDTITSHYDEFDYLTFYCNADLTKEDYTVDIKVYNSETKKLLSRSSFLPGEKYKYIQAGIADGVRNVMIECTKR